VRSLIARPIPSVGTLAYAHLAVHSAYAWAFVTLLHAKIFLKSLYGLKDDKVAAFNPHVAALSHDRPTNPFASVLTSDLALLPAIPLEISQALIDAQTLTSPVGVTALASTNDVTTASSSGTKAKPSSPSSLFGTRGLSALFLHSLSVQLESLILDTVTDVSATLPLASKKRATNAARRERTAGKGGAVVSAAAQLARKSAAAAAKKASKSAKRKRRSEDEDDVGEEEEDEEDNESKVTDDDDGKGRVSKRTSLRSRRKTDRLGAGVDTDEQEIED